MPADYHILFLHEVWQLQIIRHNDRVSTCGQLAATMASIKRRV
jgi:hypothetical protein